VSNWDPSKMNQRRQILSNTAAIGLILQTLGPMNDKMKELEAKLEKLEGGTGGE